MKKFAAASRTVLPILLLILLELAIFFTNYTPGTRLIGWDVVTPEFMFPIHLLRSLAGVWQENRGLGLFDGMSHVSNLIHTLSLWVMSFVVPNNLLRYAFILLCHLAGGVGMYALLIKLFDSTTHHHPRGVAFIGAVIYMVNLITVQMFFTPLEAFAVHFAALPWITYSLLYYLKNGTKKALIFFITLCLLCTPQYFVTTLALPVIILLVVTCATAFITQPSKTLFIRIVTAAVSFILVNSFWMLPYVAGLPKNAPIIASAKINQMSSEEIFARNQAYGDFSNVMLLRGFSLSFEDEIAKNRYGYMMEAWRSHIDTPLALVISSLMAALTLFGLVQSVRIKNRNLLPFTLIFLITTLILGNNMPVVTDVTTWLHTHVPFFSEAYRFPFTKFSLLFVFSYTILCIFGIVAFLQELVRFKRQLSTASIIVATCLVLWYASPIFTGNFLYKNLRIALPPEYEKTFTYFQQQDHNKRIALLPQPSFWSWKFFDYGFRGSGFFWQGIPQPTLDRAFDPWSRTNENYYWELSKALYSKDHEALLGVFTKYDISYVVLDEHLASASNNRTLFIDETKALLSNIPQIKMVNSFGKITIYEYREAPHDSFISLKRNLPTVFPTYTWTDLDRAYFDVGDYISYPDPDIATYIYPFRSLFTKRTADEREFDIEETTDTITISSHETATSAAILKEYARIYDSNDSGDIDSQNVVACGLVKQGISSSANITEMSTNILRFRSKDQRNCLTFDIENMPHKDGHLVRIESRHIQGRPLALSLINKTARHIELETYLPNKTEWNTSYFILPPLASDGLDYSVYIYNDSVGEKETINDLKNISIYRIPYDELLSMQTSPAGSYSDFVSGGEPDAIHSIVHQNPSVYTIALAPSLPVNTNTTLILSQSYDDGWKAYIMPNSSSQIPIVKNIQELFPFVFGTEIKEHVLVNNWQNGWILPKESITNESPVIVIFFWPQVLEWVGFLLLPLPFLIARRVHTHS